MPRCGTDEAMPGFSKQTAHVLNPTHTSLTSGTESSCRLYRHPPGLPSTAENNGSLCFVCTFLQEGEAEKTMT